jgi:MoxR-like ATPase
MAPSLVTSTAALRAASERFRGFFHELERTFVEREDLLAQVALALLAREHVLMTGPPGTAKSGIAAAVLGRIVDERTGQPSVFARQFTESTVQTDLVGPIDFKTLMQTGRTEHFTDEGMLGAVHAFLDEVLDGRDMLLRTTLNVLQERELKQGTKTTAGQIECALMTTNRYLAEVLEGSRETLLAFVDRIAFVSFVPKGFTEQTSLGRVVRTQIGLARKPLVSLLTIQDLDVLQAAADRVVVPDEICTALCVLLEHLDGDLAAAGKHDPTFQPTRYLSTRTAVRLGRILRAVCVYDAIMTGNERAFEVEHKDLAMLRLSLLLSGPNHAKLGALLEKETDPRERRQLSILRTEREIFDRVLVRLPKPTKKVVAPQSADLKGLEKAVAKAVPAASATPLLETAAKLAQVSDAGGPGSMEAASLLDSTLAHLAERSLRTGTTAGAGPTTGLDGDDASPIVDELALLAEGLEKASGRARPVARWLRGRAIRILLDAAALSSSKVGAALDARPSHAPTPAEIDHLVDRSIAPLERILDRCATLRAAGAEEAAKDEGPGRAVATAALRVEDEVALVCESGFHATVAAALARLGSEQLGVLLTALGPALADIDRHGARLAKLGARPDALRARVVAPRIEPLVREAFERVSGGDRLELVTQVGTLLQQLADSNLKATIPKATILRFAAQALTRTERRRPSTSAPSPGAQANFEAYRVLRGMEQRVSLSYTMVELALRIAPERPLPTGPAEELVASVGSFIGGLPDDLRNAIVELDLARIDRALTLVEAWWKGLAAEAAAALATGQPSRVDGAVATLAESKFFHVTRDESALLRFALESRVVGDVFPEALERVSALRGRIDAVEAESSKVLGTLRRHRADAAWSELLGPASRK